jgi:hypothetical protein
LPERLRLLAGAAAQIACPFLGRAGPKSEPGVGQRWLQTVENIVVLALERPNLPGPRSSEYWSPSDLQVKRMTLLAPSNEY